MSLTRKILNIISPLAITLCISSSCSSTRTVAVTDEQKYNLEWVGKTHHEIVTKYGAPTRSESDGNNGQILVYENVRRTIDTGADIGYGGIGGSATIRENIKYLNFFIDEDSRCYLVMTNQPFDDGKDSPQKKTMMILDLASSLVFIALLLLN